jgi:hypothetical protein
MTHHENHTDVTLPRFLCGDNCLRMGGPSLWFSGNLLQP